MEAEQPQENEVYSLTGVDNAVPKGSQDSEIPDDYDGIIEEEESKNDFEEEKAEINTVLDIVKIENVILNEEKIEQIAKDNNDTDNIINNVSTNVNNEEESINENEQKIDEDGIEVVDNYVPPTAYFSILSPEPDLSSLPPLETTPEQDAECAEWLREFQASQKAPPHSRRTKLIQYLQRLKVNALVQLKYSEASKIQEQITKLHSMINEADQTDNIQQRITSLEEKINETSLKLEEANRESEKQIEKELIAQQSRRDAIIAIQNTELDSFEEQWNNEEYLRKFAKPSAKLLQLRNVERTFVMMKEFDKADGVRKEIEEMEREESQIAQSRAEDTMKRYQKKLLEKHGSELQQFDLVCRRSMEVLQKNNNMKRDSILARQAKLSIELETLKKRKPSLLPPLVTPSNQKESQEQVITPRTAQRYNVYKAVTRNPKITVKPLGSFMGRKKTRLSTGNEN